MRRRRVRFTDTARRHVQREKSWWLANRLHPEVFAAELESVLQIMAILPDAGSPYLATDLAGVRRLYLSKAACHVYYTFDDESVVVRAVWGARRRRGPQIET